MSSVLDNRLLLTVKSTTSAARINRGSQWLEARPLRRPLTFPNGSTRAPPFLPVESETLVLVSTLYVRTPGHCTLTPDIHPIQSVMSVTWTNGDGGTLGSRRTSQLTPSLTALPRNSHSCLSYSFIIRYHRERRPTPTFSTPSQKCLCNTSCFDYAHPS